MTLVPTNKAMSSRRLVPRQAVWGEPRLGYITAQKTKEVPLTFPRCAEVFGVSSSYLYTHCRRGHLGLYHYDSLCGIQLVGVIPSEVRGLLTSYPSKGHLASDLELCDPDRALIDLYARVLGIAPEPSAYLGPVMDVMLDVQPVRDREVFALRTGYPEGIRLTLREISVVLKLSPERIRQIEAKAVRRLRHRTRSLILRHFAGISDNDQPSSS